MGRSLAVFVPSRRPSGAPSLPRPYSSCAVAPFSNASLLVVYLGDCVYLGFCCLFPRFLSLCHLCHAGPGRLVWLFDGFYGDFVACGSCRHLFFSSRFSWELSCGPRRVPVAFGPSRPPFGLDTGDINAASISPLECVPRCLVVPSSHLFFFLLFAPPRPPPHHPLFSLPLVLMLSSGSRPIVLLPFFAFNEESDVPGLVPFFSQSLFRSFSFLFVL